MFPRVEMIPGRDVIFDDIFRVLHQPYGRPEKGVLFFFLVFFSKVHSKWDKFRVFPNWSNMIDSPHHLYSICTYYRLTKPENITYFLFHVCCICCAVQSIEERERERERGIDVRESTVQEW